MSASSPRTPTALHPDSNLHRTQIGMCGALEAWRMASLVCENDGRRSYRAVRVLPGQWAGTSRRKMMTGVHFQISTMQVVAKRTALILVSVLAQPDPRPNLTSLKSTCYFPVGALDHRVDRATSKIPQVCGLIVLARNMCVEGTGVAFGDSQTRVVRTVRLDLSDGF